MRHETARGAANNSPKAFFNTEELKRAPGIKSSVPAYSTADESSFTSRISSTLTPYVLAIDSKLSPERTVYKRPSTDGMRSFWPERKSRTLSILFTAIRVEILLKPKRFVIEEMLSPDCTV